MTTPIRPSLAQMLNPQAAPARAAPQTETGSFVSALQAPKAFFRQVTAPKVTPATYTAADVANATNGIPAPSAGASAAQDANQPLRRPGSYLNIVI